MLDTKRAVRPYLKPCLDGSLAKVGVFAAHHFTLCIPAKQEPRFGYLVEDTHFDKHKARTNYITLIERGPFNSKLFIIDQGEGGRFKGKHPVVIRGSYNIFVMGQELRDWTYKRGVGMHILHGGEKHIMIDKEKVCGSYLSGLAH